MARTTLDKTGKRIKAFNALLRAEIKKTGMNEKDVAEILNIRPESMSKRMNGKVMWNIKEIFTISETLNINVEDLFI